MRYPLRQHPGKKQALPETVEPKQAVKHDTRDKAGSRWVDHHLVKLFKDFSSV
jgi:hypothetical protein